MQKTTQKSLVLLAVRGKEGPLPYVLQKMVETFDDQHWMGSVMVVCENRGQEIQQIIRLLKPTFPMRWKEKNTNETFGQALQQGLENLLLEGSLDDTLILSEVTDWNNMAQLPALFNAIGSGNDIAIAPRSTTDITTKDWWTNTLHRMKHLDWGMLDYTAITAAVRLELVRSGLDHYGQALIGREVDPGFQALFGKIRRFHPRVKQLPHLKQTNPLHPQVGNAIPLSASGNGSKLNRVA